MLETSGLFGLPLLSHLWIIVPFCSSSLVLAETECTLRSLVVRSKDSPIDLDPPFDPGHTNYRIKLDWSAEAFSVDARPDTGCGVDGVPPSPVPVPIGGSSEIMLFALHQETGEKREYMVKAFRMLGSETELRSLEVIGGELSPPFDERTREYTVKLSLAQDIARIEYGLIDSEQRITGSAGAERPSSESDASALTDGFGGSGGGSGSGSEEEHASGNSNSTSSGKGGEGSESHQKGASNSTAEERRLRRLSSGDDFVFDEPGEAQFRTATLDFLLDVGFSRSVELTVQCADPTQASIGTYTLHITRPGCEAERPFFNPEKKVCVNFCSSGYYRNRETHRCSMCNENCKICSNLLTCDMCLPDSEDFTYVIQPDGKCRAVENHLFKKYQWWCVGLGVLLTFLLLIGCCGVVQYCCSGDKSSKRTGSFAHFYDSDSDDDHHAGKYHRAPGRLGRY